MSRQVNLNIGTMRKLRQSVRELDPRFRGPDLEGNEMKRRLVNSSIMASVTAVVVVMWVMLASVLKTSAIPAFSRKYQTSCTTCHNNYPELNDYGVSENDRSRTTTRYL